MQLKFVTLSLACASYPLVLAENFPSLPLQKVETNKTADALSIASQYQECDPVELPCMEHGLEDVEADVPSSDTDSANHALPSWHRITNAANHFRRTKDTSFTNMEFDGRDMKRSLIALLIPIAVAMVFF